MNPVPDRPVKILRIITRLNIGGPAQHVLYLTERMNNALFSTVLAAGSLGPGDGDMEYLAASHGVAIVRVPGLGNGSRVIGDIRALVDLYRLIRHERPDIVHLHLLKARCLGGLAARLARVPVVLETMHGHLLQGYYGRAKTNIILAMERLIGRWFVDAVIALSNRQREDFERWRIAEPAKLHVLSLGLELDPFLAVSGSGRGALRREIGVAEDTLLVGAVGRMIPIKGYDILLQAIRDAAPALDGRIVAALAGDGPCRRDLEAQASRLGINDHVRFLGWRNDLPALYRDFDIVAQPSLNEGTPVSLIEAMATRRAVVASSVGGVPDVVEDGQTGLLVPSRDTAALATAIIRLARDPDLRCRLGRNARRAVYPRFEVGRLVTELGSLYLGQLAGRTRVSPEPDLIPSVPAPRAATKPR